MIAMNIISERKATINMQFPIIRAIYSFSLLKKCLEITVGIEDPDRAFDNTK